MARAKLQVPQPPLQVQTLGVPLYLVLKVCEKGLSLKVCLGWGKATEAQTVPEGRASAPGTVEVTTIAPAPTQRSLRVKALGQIRLLLFPELSHLLLSEWL